VGTAGQRESGRGGNNGADSSGPRGREGGREGALARLTDRRGSPVSAGAQARPTWANWARLAFSIFSRVFNSNSNQVSNSNQIKYMQQFKEYLDSI
jgi:hypothetical protein